MTRIELLNYNLDMMLEHDEYDPYQESILGKVGGHLKRNWGKYTAATALLGGIAAYTKKLYIKADIQHKRINNYLAKYPELNKAIVEKEYYLVEHPRTKAFFEQQELFKNNPMNYTEKEMYEAYREYYLWELRELLKTPGINNHPALVKLLKERQDTEIKITRHIFSPKN